MVPTDCVYTRSRNDDDYIEITVNENSRNKIERSIG